MPLHSHDLMSRSFSSSSASSLDTIVLQRKLEKIPFQILSILQSRVLPEAEILDEDIELDEKIILETRVRVAKVMLEIICLNVDPDVTRSPSGDVFGSTSLRSPDTHPTDSKGIVKTVVGTIAQWYRAGNGSPWKAVLEKALQQIVGLLSYPSYVINAWSDPMLLLDYGRMVYMRGYSFVFVEIHACRPEEIALLICFSPFE